MLLMIPHISLFSSCGIGRLHGMASFHCSEHSERFVYDMISMGMK